MSHDLQPPQPTVHAPGRALPEGRESPEIPAAAHPECPDNFWWVWDAGPCPPTHNMAWDEALLHFVAREDSRPVLRLYGWTVPAASFGYFQRYQTVAAATPLRPLVRRPTGGGLVPHASDWTYALAIPAGHSWHRLRAEESYIRLHTWLQTAFRDVGIPTELAPEARRPRPGCCFEGHERHDLLWNGRKIAGAAQRRTRTGLLIQGSIQPPAAGWDRATFHQALLHAAQLLWGVRWKAFEPPADLIRHHGELLQTRYDQPAYHRRR